ncbi:Sbal_3080 family lipoprotein [uncultured Shewanella sp.]|uniref:Sbal_3080 family lipoprotein n=1 Tax=uncultured Shewanella sp. TaxID=173975 RepID=UPI0026168892|nr:Sbal_3080 family lipoprotein [uncultured Shewanella sp.]
MMKRCNRFLFALMLLVGLSGCGSPGYMVKPIEVMTNKAEVVIVKDDKTREGFLQTMEDWLSEHHYVYKVVNSGSKHDLSQLTLEYEGLWRWDLALYLQDAEIKAYQQGQKVGEVDFHVPYTMNPSKFGDAEKRIRLMMAALFGKISAEDATKIANSSEKY